MATGQTRTIGAIIPKKSNVPGKTPTGTTLGEIFSNLPDKKLWGYDGANIFEYGVNSYLALTGGTLTGNTRIIGSISADTYYNLPIDVYITGGTYSEGTFTFYNNTGGTFVITGVTTDNFFTTGATLVGTTAIFNRNDTLAAYTLQLSGLTSGITASASNGLNTTGGTIQLGGFLTIDTTIDGQLNGLHLIQLDNFLVTSDNDAIINVGTGDLRFNSAFGGINLSGNQITIYGSTLVNGNLSSTGSSVFNSASATTFSASTINSGSTNLYSIFQSLGTNSTIDNGVNTYTGGSFFNQTVNVSALTINSLTVSGSSTLSTVTAITLSAGTIFSGGTNLYNIFSTTDTNDITRIQPGSNIVTGGTDNNPTINLIPSPSVNNLSFSGIATGNAISAITISASTINSGSTNLYNVFQPLGANSTLGNGLNTYTGGSFFNQTVNVSALTINSLTVLGSSTLNSLTATTFSASTINSGSTNLYNIFSTTDTNDITRIQPGSNIVTGGTDNNPTINLISSPSVNNLSFSGIATGNAISAITISASTINSGSTNLYGIFQTLGSNPVIGNGINTYTGGTILNPMINVSALTINSLTVSGNSTLNLLTAATFSAGTINSGSTNLYNIFQLLGANSTIGNGINTYTGGSFFNQTVNVSALTINSLVVSGSSNINGLTATTFSATSISGGTLLLKNVGFSGASILTVQNTGGTITAFITNSGGLSATSISATTYYGIPTVFGSGASGNGGTINSGVTGYVVMGHSGTITGWDLIGATSGTIVMDIWHATGSTLPTVANSITDVNKPRITSGVYSGSTTLTNWSGLTYQAGDKFGFNIDSVTGFTSVSLTIRGVKQ